MSDNVKMPAMKKKVFNMALLIISMLSTRVLAHEYFNLQALEIDNPSGEHGDASAINMGIEQIPGNYNVSVYVNGKFKNVKDISFLAGGDNNLHPNLTYADLIDFGVDKNFVKKLVPHSMTDTISDLSLIMPGVTIKQDLDALNLYITIPQKYTDQYLRGTPALDSDNGVNAAFINYDISGTRKGFKTNDNSIKNSYFLLLRNGLNMKSWHFRSTVENSTENQKKIFIQNSYIEKDLPLLQSRLIFGDGYTSSDILESHNMRGLQMSTEDDMLDDSEKGYSPVIHGIAPYEGKVGVYRKGFLLYETDVVAGPFELRNLPTEAGEGEIEVRVTSPSGKQTLYYYNFPSLPIMQRRETSRYSFAIGKLTENKEHQPDFVQYSYAKGLTNYTTIYAGIFYSKLYQNLLSGVGVSLGRAGALSADIAVAMINGYYSTGGIRTRYNKSFDDTGTVLSINNTYYPDQNFETLTQASILESFVKKEREQYTSLAIHHKSQISLNQQIPVGNLYLSLESSYYRNKKNNELAFNAGYSFSIFGLSITVNLARMKRYLKQRSENQFSLLVQAPLNFLSRNAIAGISLTSSGKQSIINETISGSGMDMNELIYSFQKSKSLSGGSDNSYSINGGYYSNHYLGKLGYSHDSDQERINYGLQGGIVAHSGGITFSQPLGETFALVNTDNQENIFLSNSRGIHSDSHGWLVAPLLTSYRKNTLHLQVAENDNQTEINDSIHTINPAYGSIAMVNFKVKRGGKALFTVHYRNGFIPFGATVSSDDQEGNSGIASSDGSVYLSGLREHGVIVAQWGHSKSCHAQFELNRKDAAKKTGIVRKDLFCV